MSVDNGNITYKILFGIAIAIVAYFGTAYFNKLNEIQKDLIALQIKVTELQGQIITRADVKEMIASEIRYYHKELFQ